MILHLLFDDIFGDYAIRQFSGEEMRSEFVVVSDSSECSFLKERIRVVLVGTEDFLQLQSSLNHYNAVVFHGLFYPWQEKLLRTVPDHVKVAWVFWGGEIYCRKDVCARFLTPRSKALVALQRMKRWLRNKKQPSGYEIPFDLLKRIDYCLTDVPEDFVFVKKYLGTPIVKLWYNYYSIEETIGDLLDESIDGTNVLLGNSCTIECNHLDGFMRLSHLPLKDSKIVVPLSYGPSWLRSFLLKEGKRQFGGCFCPLVEFLPRSEYNAVLKSCSVAIMPHYRPQAFGNILTALWLGTRVYLSEKNILYPFFKRLGVVVFSIEHDLKRSNPSVFLPLSNDQVEQNRCAISAVYSKEKMHQRNLELVRILNQ